MRDPLGEARQRLGCEIDSHSAPLSKLIVADPWIVSSLLQKSIRPREHLTEREVEKLIETAKGNRHGQRDAAMILICFRHGLRASELCELQWSDVEFESATLHLRRAKGGATEIHPLLGDELRALRVLKRNAQSPFIFVSERASPFTVSGLQKLIERAGIEAKMPFKVHPHMLHHATGYALANKGTDVPRQLLTLSSPCGGCQFAPQQASSPCGGCQFAPQQAAICPQPRWNHGPSNYATSNDGKKAFIATASFADLPAAATSASVSN